jgi:hypothetical protein
MLIERGFASEHLVDGPRQFMRQHGEGLAVAVVFLRPSQVFLGGWIVSQEQHGGFGEGPCRKAWPIFVPEVPKRVPAAYLAHSTRRR